MSNRWLRFVIALIALAALGAAGYRIRQQEVQLTAASRMLGAGDDAADTAIETIGEIKAALHAYVAPGQGQPFWNARSAMLLDKLRSSLLELDKVATTLNAPITETLDLSDRLAAAEQRAREHVRNGQPLLAGDVIFNDSRDLIDAIRVQVARARGLLAQTGDARQAATRREQLMAALGAAAIAALALLILVPPTGTRDADLRPSASAAATSAKSAAEPAEYARIVPTPKTAPAPAAASSPPVPSGARRSATAVPVASVARPASASGHATASRTTPATVKTSTELPAPVPPPPAPPSRWPEAAALCTDIARLSDSQDISRLLGRAASLLNASGIVVWMASDGRDSLVPAAASGYDERLVSRIGTIARTDDNLTANAFRDGSPRTSKSRAGSQAALAVPLLTPSGAAGVLSAELRDAQEVDPQQLAIATIVAAQLSMVLTTTAAPAVPDAAVAEAQG